MLVLRIKKIMYEKQKRPFWKIAKICHSLHEKIRSCLYWVLYMKTIFSKVIERIQSFVSKRSAIIIRISDLAALFKAGEGELNQDTTVFILLIKLILIKSINEFI